METLKAIATRKSTRAYKSTQISEAELDIILCAGCAAPGSKGSNSNLYITVIQNPELLQKISRVTAMKLENSEMDPLYGAPTLIVLSAKNNPDMPYSEIFNYLNCSCVAENMIIAATDIGLGSVYNLMPILGLKNNNSLLEQLCLPKEFLPIVTLLFGYSIEPLQERVLIKKILINTIK